MLKKSAFFIGTISVLVCILCFVASTEDCKHVYNVDVIPATTTQNGTYRIYCAKCEDEIGSGKVPSAVVSLSKSEYIFDGTKKKPKVYVKNSGGDDINAENYTTEYSNNASTGCGVYTATVKFTKNYTGKKSLKYKILPAKPTNTTVKSTKAFEASLNFDKVAGADFYEVYYSTSKDGKYTKIGETTKTAPTIKKLKGNTTYYFKVRAGAYYEGGTVYGAYSSVKSVKVKSDKNYIMTQKDGITYITDTDTNVKFILVNKKYSVPKSYAPAGLTKDCNTQFKKLVAAAKKDGITIKSISGYRSYDYQKSLHKKYVEQYGEKTASTVSALEGHSEHQLGLAIDCNSLKESFANTKEGKWLKAHCAEYGFIIRYAKDKTSSTGYAYEPWHIRYMGSVELAKKITKSGKSIEEYYGLT